MKPLTLGLFLSIALAGRATRAADHRSVLDVLETLWTGIDDFRCEYEGSVAVKDKVAVDSPELGDNGAQDEFSGRFVWKADGSTRVDILHRDVPSGKITREQLLVSRTKSEQYVHMEERRAGEALVHDPNLVNADRDGSLGAIFVPDIVRRLSCMRDIEISRTEDELKGRRCTVLTFSYKGMGPFQKFWIDTRRGGHAIRREIYIAGNLAARAEIVLGSFDVGDKKVWLPVSGLIEGHSSMKDGKPYFPKEPTYVQTIYINSGTLEFNTHPAADTFTANYRPGTPVTDRLKKLQYAFSQQKSPPPPTRVEAERDLKAKLAQAETQKNELVAGSPAGAGAGWSSRLVWVFGGCALAFSVALLFSRRR